MKVLTVHNQGKKKIKQVYTVDLSKVEYLNGTGEPGHPLVFYPEGTISGEFITKRQLALIQSGSPVQGHACMVYPL